MKVTDPGHKYQLDMLDEHGITGSDQMLVFLKRDSGSKKHDINYSGTNTQEVLRALIDRTQYLNDILPCNESQDAIYHLRMALFSYEARALRRKYEDVNRKAPEHFDENVRGHGENRDIPFTEWEIENQPTGRDGHIKV